MALARYFPCRAVVLVSGVSYGVAAGRLFQHQRDDPAGDVSVLLNR